MNRLKELRINAGLSQTQLAEAAATTQRNISYWESGRIEMNINAAIKLAQVLQVEVEYLAGYSDELGKMPELKANAAVPSGDGINVQERELLEEYRALSPNLQKMVRDTIKTFLTSKQNEWRKA